MRGERASVSTKGAWASLRNHPAMSQLAACEAHKGGAGICFYERGVGVSPQPPRHVTARSPPVARGSGRLVTIERRRRNGATHIHAPREKRGAGVVSEETM